MSGICDENYGINIIETNVLKYPLMINKKHSKQTFWNPGNGVRCGNKGNFYLKSNWINVQCKIQIVMCKPTQIEFTLNN